MPRFSAPAEVRGVYRPPPSKSYTHRALVAAALAEGRSEVRRPLISDDTDATARALRMMGACIRARGRGAALEVTPPPSLSPPPGVIDCRGSGTTIRLMASVASLASSSTGYTVLTGNRRLVERPMGPLLDALSRLGVEAFSTRGNGLPPVVVKGGGMPGGRAELDASYSSQFASSLLMAAPRSERGVELSVDNVVSRPYIDSTIAVMGAFGASVERDGYEAFRVKPTGYRGTSFDVPGDYSSASFMMALAAMVGGELRVEGLGRLPQADAAIVEVLRAMGAEVDLEGGSAVRVRSDGHLTGGEFDLVDSPDLLPVVAVLGLVADGSTRITGIGHTRVKESDRPAAIAAEVRRIGGYADVGDGWLEVRRLEGASASDVPVHDHDDHRIYMAFAVLSAALGGAFSLAESRSFTKSYPGFMEDLRALGVEVY